MLLPLTALAVVLADQVVKAVVRARLPVGEPVPLIPGVLWLTHVSNTGGAFSILSGWRWVFMAASATMVVVVTAVWIAKRPRGLLAFALGLLGGGAAGNLVDRVALGRVTDYLDVRWWPVFNIADMAVVSGTALLVLLLLLADRTVPTEER